MKYLKSVAISGEYAKPSRTRALVKALISELDQHLALDSHVIQLGDIARSRGSELPCAGLAGLLEYEL